MQSFLNVAVWVWLAEIFHCTCAAWESESRCSSDGPRTGFLRFFPALVEAIHINGVFFRFPG
jgi:hypothetical protein